MARGVWTASTTLTAADLNDAIAAPACSCRRSTNQSINNATDTVITLDTELFDVGSMHSTVTNTSRITIPTGGGGTYLICGQVTFAANTTGQRNLDIWKNGTTRIGNDRKNMTVASQECTLSILMFEKLVATDYIELRVQQDSGGALNVLTKDPWSPSLAVIWVAI